MRTTLYVDPDLGKIDVPEALKRITSYPGGPAHMAIDLREVGVFVAKSKRPVFHCGGAGQAHMVGRCGRMAYAHERGVCRDPKCLVRYGTGGPCGEPKCLVRFDLMWASISHNERVDDGAAAQDALLFGAGTTRFTIVAVANATLAGKAQTDSSLGANAASGTTNEFTTIGLSRAAGSLGAYTAPASLGATFSRVVTKTFTASGSGTAYGAGLFDSATVSGSILYVEDNFSSTAVLVSGDTLQVNATISN